MNLFLQIVSLLILSEDIEENPGPVSGSSNEGIFSKECFQCLIGSVCIRMK